MQQLWMVIGAVPGVVLVCWVLLNLKTSRKDGTLLKPHKVRVMMQYIMRTRTESAVYFDVEVPAQPLLDYLDEVRPHVEANVTHACVAAALIGLEAAPQMNRFTVGQRLYQRRQREVSFSLKRKKGDAGAKMSTVKLVGEDRESFRDFCQRVNGSIAVERSGERTYADKEYDFFAAIPRPVLSWGVRLMRWLDAHNVLPHSFIANDPLYTSMFVANLGSIEMGAAFHHLYEWGNCPLFLVVGKVEDRLVRGDDDKPTWQKVLPLRFTFDERVEDGLTARAGLRVVEDVLTHPRSSLGCIGDDVFPMRPPVLDDDTP